jgi:DNA-binding transcriptional regulator PaaX
MENHFLTWKMESFFARRLIQFWGDDQNVPDIVPLDTFLKRATLVHLQFSRITTAPKWPRELLLGNMDIVAFG